MNFPTSIGALCPPALVYLGLSALSFILGSQVLNLIHVIGILVWAFILNYICQIGYTKISWLLVIAPIALVFFSTYSLTKILNTSIDLNGSTVSTQPPLTTNAPQSTTKKHKETIPKSK
jgi:hypothetical protein